jgi:hypothetical protein
MTTSSSPVGHSTSPSVPALIGDLAASAERRVTAQLSGKAKQIPVRLNVELSESLKEELDAYAVEHSRLYEPVETSALIPRMLQAFLRTDRAWCSGRRWKLENVFPKAFARGLAKSEK